MVNVALVGFILDIIGKVMVAYTAVAVHRRFWREHRIDEEVFAAMHREQRIGIAGIILMVLGFLLQLPAKI